MHGAAGDVDDSTPTLRIRSRLTTTAVIQNGHHLEVGQRDERRGQQELVGDRIEERAQPRLPAVGAGDVAVQHVGEARQAEHGERPGLPPVHQECDEERDQQDAKERQPVRKSHGVPPRRQDGIVAPAPAPRPGMRRGQPECRRAVRGEVWRPAGGFRPSLTRSAVGLERGEEPTGQLDLQPDAVGLVAAGQHPAALVAWAQRGRRRDTGCAGRRARRRPEAVLDALEQVVHPVARPGRDGHALKPLHQAMQRRAALDAVGLVERDDRRAGRRARARRAATSTAGLVVQPGMAGVDHVQQHVGLLPAPRAWP